MARLIEVIPHLHAALTGARAEDVTRIDDGLRRFGVAGVHGEPEVGVTRLVEAAIRRGSHDVIRLDLVGATDDSYVSWVLARELAASVVGRATLSQMHAPPGLRPTSADRAFIAFAERAGEAVAQLATSPGPPRDVSITQVLDAVERTYENETSRPVLWIDHLQAPRLTPRHPIDVNKLLWSVRSLRDRVELPVLVSGSRTATHMAYREEGAFRGDGIWLEVERPSVDVWVATARAALPQQSLVHAEWIADMARIAQRHPATMLLALALSTELSFRSPLDMWQSMLSLDDGHTARAIDHARSLNRLGGRVLESIARGAGPYAGRQGASIQEIHRAVSRLHEAGLITQPAQRQWEVTNPLVAARLRGDLPMQASDAMSQIAHDAERALIRG